MRKLAILAAAALSTLAVAQSPLITYAGANNNYGNTGNQVFFNMDVLTTVTFTSFATYMGAGTVGATGNIDVYVKLGNYNANTTNSALWALVASGPVPIVNTPGNPGGGRNTCTFNTPFALGPGQYAFALIAGGFAFGYNNTAAQVSNTELVFNPSTRTGLSAPASTGGGAQNIPWTLPTFAPRTANLEIAYTLGGTPLVPATWDKVGRGCYAFYQAFYENFAATTGLDLGTAGGGLYNSMKLQAVGAQYFVGPGSNTWFAPTPAATVFAGADDAEYQQALPQPFLYPVGGVLQSTTVFNISTNGCISPGAGNGTDFTPTVAEFLNLNPRWAHWCDFDSLAGGSMSFEVSGGKAYVTYDNVYLSGVATSPSQWQVSFEFATGNVEFTWGAMSQLGGGAWPVLIGWSPGGGVLNPGNYDLSAVAANAPVPPGPITFSTFPLDNPPLDHSATARPTLGSSFNLVTSNIPTGTPFGIEILSFVPQIPGVELTFLGMAGCYQNLGLTGASINLIFPAGSSATFPFAIPANPIYVGTLLYAQAATASAGFNPLGWISSNAVRLTVGNL